MSGYKIRGVNNWAWCVKEDASFPVPSIPLKMNNQLHWCITEGTHVPADEMLPSSPSSAENTLVLLECCISMALLEQGRILRRFLTPFPLDTRFPLRWRVQFSFLDWADHCKLSSAKLLSVFLISVWSNEHALGLVGSSHCPTCHWVEAR